MPNTEPHLRWTCGSVLLAGLGMATIMTMIGAVIATTLYYLRP